MTDKTAPRRGDWVTCIATGHVGYVKRAARSGAWADVRWQERSLGEWVKRMRAEHVRVEHTIEVWLPGEWQPVRVTDVTRQRELEMGS